MQRSILLVHKVWIKEFPYANSSDETLLLIPPSYLSSERYQYLVLKNVGHLETIEEEKTETLEGNTFSAFSHYERRFECTGNNFESLTSNQIAICMRRKRSGPWLDEERRPKSLERPSHKSLDPNLTTTFARLPPRASSNPDFWFSTNEETEAEESRAPKRTKSELPPRVKLPIS